MKEIKYYAEMTQYLRHGRTKTFNIPVPDSFANMLEEMKELDLHFTCEQTMRREPVTYITHDVYGDYDIELGQPFELANRHLEILKNRWDFKKAQEWINSQAAADEMYRLASGIYNTCIDALSGPEGKGEKK